jgi:DNA-binding GntR family transcriptional regulator
MRVCLNVDVSPTPGMAQRSRANYAALMRPLPTHDPRPPYLLAADKLRTEIASGRLKPGDRLPSARDMRDDFGIAYATVQSALRVLRDEGLIYTVHGRGSYVADPENPPSGSVAGIVAQLKADGLSDPQEIQRWRRELKEAAELFAEMRESGASGDASANPHLADIHKELLATTRALDDLRETVERLEHRVDRLEQPSAD